MKKLLIPITIVISVITLVAYIFNKSDKEITTPSFEVEKNQKIDNSKLEIIKQEITDTINQSEGEFGVVIEYLEFEQRVEINTDKQFYAASLTKVPLLITLYRMYDEGKITPETKVSHLEEDSEWGDGTIKNDPFGTEYTLEQIAWHLAQESDNVAKNILYRTLPWEEIQKTFDNIGIPTNTQENKFTTGEMAKVWQYLYKSTNPSLVTEINPDSDITYLSANSVHTIFNLLTGTTTEERIPAAVPKNVKVSHKIGTWSETGSWHDCGIVFSENPVLVCIMSQNTTYEEAVDTIKKVVSTATSLQ